MTPRLRRQTVALFPLSILRPINPSYPKKIPSRDIVLSSHIKGAVKMERIMIIDSDLSQLNPLKESLSREYLTLGCNRGTKAMDLFQIFQPSVIILDPATHDLNSREFIRKVKTTPYRGGATVLALCRMTTLLHIEESLGWGVDMVFSKPCNLELMAQKLNRHFGRLPGVPEPVGA